MGVRALTRGISLAFVLSIAATAYAGPGAAKSEHSWKALEKAFHAPAIKKILAAQEADAQADERRELLRQLEDKDSSVREAAARSLKSHIQDNTVRHKLVEVAEDRDEEAAVRVQAVKSLSFAAGQSASGRYGSGNKVRDRFLALAKNPHTAETVRVISLKALYAAQDDKVWEAAADIMESPYFPLEVRKAAAWGLFANTDSKVRARLLNAAKNHNFDTGLRLEAVKSLFSWSSNRDIYENLLNLAKKPVVRDPAHKDLIREMAVSTLQGANQYSTVRRFLEDTARGDSNPKIRSAAIRALERFWGMETVRFFHLNNYRGMFVDPLETE